RNASMILGLTIHRRTGIPAQPAGNMVPVTTNPITALDLSLADNKIAMLAQLNGAVPKVLTVPSDVKTYGEEYEDHVLEHALLLLKKDGKDTPGLLSRNVKKDVLVIRSLAAMHEAITPDADFVKILSTGLPDPIKKHMARFGPS